MLFYVVMADTDAAGEWVRYGLLGLVLVWLFYVRWPANDKIIKDMIEKHDAQLEKKDLKMIEERAKHDQIEKEQRTDFRDMAQAILTHCEKGDMRKESEITELRKLLFAQQGKSAS